MDNNFERETILVVDDVKENLDVLDGLFARRVQHKVCHQW